MQYFTCNYQISKTKFFRLCRCGFIEYFVKKLILFKCVTGIHVGNI